MAIELGTGTLKITGLSSKGASGAFTLNKSGSIFTTGTIVFKGRIST